MADQETANTLTAAATAGAAAADATPTAAPQIAVAFTQADIDRIVKERIDRERAKFADYDKLKAAQAELDQIKAAQMSDEEKRQARVRELEEQAQAAQSESAATLAKANERLIRAAIIAEASVIGFVNATDAYALVDMAAIAIDEAGEVSGAPEAVKALAEKRPYLLRKQAGGAPNTNGGAGSFTGSDLPRLTAEQERIARGMNISLEAYAKRLLEAQQAQAIRR